MVQAWGGVGCALAGGPLLALIRRGGTVIRHHSAISTRRHPARCWRSRIDNGRLLLSCRLGHGHRCALQARRREGDGRAVAVGCAPPSQARTRPVPGTAMQLSRCDACVEIAGLGPPGRGASLVDAEWSDTCGTFRCWDSTRLQWLPGTNKHLGPVTSRRYGDAPFQPWSPSPPLPLPLQRRAELRRRMRSSLLPARRASMGLHAGTVRRPGGKPSVTLGPVAATINGSTECLQLVEPCRVRVRQCAVHRCPRAERWPLLFLRRCARAPPFHHR